MIQIFPGVIFVSPIICAMDQIIKYEIRQVTWPERYFIVKRAIIKFDDLSVFFGESYRHLYCTVQNLGLTSSGPPCAFYYSINEVKKETDVAAAVPVKENLSTVKDIDKIVIPPSKVLMTTYYGSYENMAAPYAEMEKHLKEHNETKELTIEEYFTDPSIEQDSNKWKTNIYFILK
jgi:effector-binding domain-containing protein